MKPNNYKLNRLAPEYENLSPYTLIKPSLTITNSLVLNHTNPIFHILVNFNIQFLLMWHIWHM